MGTVTYNPLLTTAAFSPDVRDYRFGHTLTVTGTGGATVELDAAQKFDHTITKIELVNTAGGANDYDLYDGVHNQELYVALKTTASVNATLTANAGVTIVDIDGDAVTTITFSAANKFALLKYEVNRWRVIVADATVA